ncbi:MAG TPA: SRPBCC family protein [Candidatus Acidoferrum sp.]|nr:SRPBCC family protein [Candidatus Acidoferrum sp.]
MNGLASANTPSDMPPWKGALLGIAAGMVYGLGGFFVLRVLESPRMGATMFLLLPFVVGATIALITPRPIAAIAIISAGISLLLCLLTLVSAHAEGVLCALIAFPIVFVSLAIGVGIGLLLRLLLRNLRPASMSALVFLAGPALIFGGHGLEKRELAQPRTEAVVTTVHLKANPEDVWANIQSLDSLTGKKPFLMYVGLPIPQKCVLQGKAVGSKRTCYFDQGYIEETILEWDPPRRMLLSIDRTNMPGRHWLEFTGAEYDLQPSGDGTTITRITTIESNLSPAWYWARFERWGVQSEHEYLFRDLAKRLAPAN